MKTFLYPLVGMLLFLAGCGNGITHSSPTGDNASDLTQNGPRTSEFKDLDQGDAYTARLETPTLFVAGSVDETAAFIGWLNDAGAVRRIQGVDFNTTWVIAVFRGMVGSAGYGIEVKDVQFIGETVQLKVNLTDPDPDQMVAQVISYPYHIITAPKEFLPIAEGTTWSVSTSEGRMLTRTRYPISPRTDTPDGLRVDYFPLEVGKVWTYGDQAGAFRVTTPIRTIYGPAYGTEGLLQNRVLRKTEDGKVLELRGDEWRLLFDFAAEEKTSWTIEAPAEGSDLLGWDDGDGGEPVGAGDGAVRDV